MKQEFIPVRAHGGGCKPRHLAQFITRQYRLDGCLVTGKVAVTLCNHVISVWNNVADTGYNYTDGSPYMIDCPTCKDAQP